ncbi:hypothetical protein, partial [Cypionkella sp. TWP1-2-1b2]|uniref:hypothetical protein n=1 Tax=Cypionkella sp. TWP1-2-1b2 TaxID=2804675 RepID=UPI003CF06798
MTAPSMTATHIRMAAMRAAFVESTAASNAQSEKKTDSWTRARRTLNRIALAPENFSLLPQFVQVVPPQQAFMRCFRASRRSYDSGFPSWTVSDSLIFPDIGDRDGQITSYGASQ